MRDYISRGIEEISTFLLQNVTGVYILVNVALKLIDVLLEIWVSILEGKVENELDGA